MHGGMKTSGKGNRSLVFVFATIWILHSMPIPQWQLTPSHVKFPLFQATSLELVSRHVATLRPDTTYPSIQSSVHVEPNVVWHGSKTMPFSGGYSRPQRLTMLSYGGNNNVSILKWIDKVSGNVLTIQVMAWSACSTNSSQIKDINIVKHNR